MVLAVMLLLSVVSAISAQETRAASSNVKAKDSARFITNADRQKGRDALGVMKAAFPDCDGVSGNVEVGNALKVLTDVLNFGPNDPVTPELAAKTRNATKIIEDALNSLPDDSTVAGKNPKGHPNGKTRREAFAVIQNVLNF